MSNDPYRTAPTWLFNEDGDTKLFKTQEEVDRAWDDGWFGPAGLGRRTPLLSEVDWTDVTRAEILEVVHNDPRYDGLSINPNRSKKDMVAAMRKFEEENELS